MQVDSPSTLEIQKVIRDLFGYQIQVVFLFCFVFFAMYRKQNTKYIQEPMEYMERF